MPKKLQGIVREISETAVTPRWNPIIEMTALSVVFLCLDIFLIRQYTRQTPSLVAAQVVAWALIPAVVILAVYMSIRLKQFRAAIPEMLRGTGVLKKVSLGPDGLPDIYAYTPFPFTLTLGPRPRSLKAQIRFVATHILWYMRDKPSVYFGIGWQGAAQSFLFVVFLWSTTGASQDPIVRSCLLLFGFIVAVEYPLIGAFAARNSYAARAFVEELSEDVSGNY